MAEKNLDRRQLFEKIRSALREMPELLSRTFMLSHYRGLSYCQIARELGVTEPEVPELLKEAENHFYSRVGLAMGNGSNGG